MNWNHLYCFYEVAKNNSLKDASRKMGLASSTVSEQVKKLEEAHGLDLFSRKGRELVLTTEGERVFTYAKEMFAKGKRLVDSLSFNDEAGYSVRVSIETHLENRTIDNFIKKYWKNYSAFGLVETKRSKNLSQSIYFLEHDVVDWMITSSDLIDTRFDKVKIGELSYDFYCSDELYEKYKDKRELLKRIPLGRFGTTEDIEESIKAHFLDLSYFPKEQFFSEHSELLLSLCRDGEIITFLPSFKNYKPAGLKRVEVAKDFNFPIYGMYKKSNGQLLYIRKLIELLSELNIQPENLAQIPYVNLSGWRPVDVKIN